MATLARSFILLCGLLPSLFITSGCPLTPPPYGYEDPTTGDDDASPEVEDPCGPFLVMDQWEPDDSPRYEEVEVSTYPALQILSDPRVLSIPTGTLTLELEFQITSPCDVPFLLEAFRMYVFHAGETTWAGLQKMDLWVDEDFVGSYTTDYDDGSGSGAATSPLPYTFASFSRDLWLWPAEPRLSPQLIDPATPMTIRVVWNIDPSAPAGTILQVALGQFWWHTTEGVTTRHQTAVADLPDPILPEEGGYFERSAGITAYIVE